MTLALGLSAAACTEEPTQQINFGTSTTTPAPAPGEDPNAAARSQIQQLAEQECIDHPERAEGVIQIADPDTGEVVSEYRIDCDTFELVSDLPFGAPPAQE